PQTAGTFLFNKGKSHNYLYENLSGGEKAAFDLLLDFIIKAKVFDNTVYCIDEPELHMHSNLQGKLLNELYNQLPDDCQLWIATHSIGMMRQAMDMYRRNPDKVVFLDFDVHDFDKQVVMTPTKVDRQFWKKVFSVALDDIAELIAPQEIVFCEGKPFHNRGDTFDADVYSTIFSATHPQTEFIPLDGSEQVEKNSLLIEGVLGHMFSSISMWRVLDRDDRNGTEIAEAKAKGTKILKRRTLESYLWDDEILELFCESENNHSAIAGIKAEKTRIISELAKQGKPKDNMKFVGNQLYVYMKKNMQLNQRGNNAFAFAKQNLAPLITPDTNVYKELEKDIFG
ncbi:MAG: AAA family ATPase, partial [Bacteroidota bacterium]